MTVRNVNGTWRVDTVVDNRRYRGATDATSKREAEKVEARVRAQLADGVPPKEIITRTAGRGAQNEAKANPTPAWTLGDAIDRALQGEWKHHRSRNSYHLSNTRVLKRMIGMHTPMDEITSETIRALRDEYAEKVAPATWNRYMQVLNSLIVLCRDEWDKPYPRKTKPLKWRLKESERFRILWPGEEAKLLEAAEFRVGPVYRDFLVASLDTGWRLSEGLAVTDNEVDLVNRSVTLWDTKFGSRTLPLTRRATVALEQHTGHNGRLFRWPKDRNTLYFRRTREAAGIHDDDLTFHCLRHTCATRLLESGRDIHVVSRWLGHADLKTTQRYAKVLPGMLTEARDALEISHS